MAREMPSFCIFESKVVRLSPSREAAPLFPPTIQLVSASAWRMCSRSASLSETAGDTAPLTGQSSESELAALNSDNGSRNIFPGERMTARSMKFCNSRILPGHWFFSSSFRAPVGRLLIALCMRWLQTWTKCRTSNGMSAARSRNAGNRIGKTFSR